MFQVIGKSYWGCVCAFLARSSRRAESHRSFQFYNQCFVPAACSRKFFCLQNYCVVRMHRENPACLWPPTVSVNVSDLAFCSCMEEAKPSAGSLRSICFLSATVCCDVATDGRGGVWRCHSSVFNLQWVLWACRVQSWLEQYGPQVVFYVAIQITHSGTAPVSPFGVASRHWDKAFRNRVRPACLHSQDSRRYFFRWHNLARERACSRTCYIFPRFVQLTSERRIAASA